MQPWDVTMPEEVAVTVVDFKKDPIYKAKTEPNVIDVPEMLFVMVDGEGAPESSDDNETEFQAAMHIIFGITYAIKFWDKKHETPNGYTKFTLAPIEGLWWTQTGNDFNLATPEDWRWTAMMRLPDFVTPRYFKQVVDELMDKKASDIYTQARLERFREGPSIQALHIGPYAEEQPTVNKMLALAEQNDLKITGKHHELYFGDPRQTKPENLRTIIRLPFVYTREINTDTLPS